MAFKDILVALTSYPEPTPVSVVEDAVSVASALGAHIAALSCEMHVQLPGHFISGSTVGLPGPPGSIRLGCSARGPARRGRAIHAPLDSNRDPVRLPILYRSSRTETTRAGTVGCIESSKTHHPAGLPLVRLRGLDAPYH